MTRLTALLARSRRTYGLRLLWEPRVQIVAVIVAVVAHLAYRSLYYVGLYNGDVWGYDFAAYWLAGQNFLASQSIYAPHQLAGPYPPQAFMLYLYPPFLAAAIAPYVSFVGNVVVGVTLWQAGTALLLAATIVAVAWAEGFRRPLQLLLLLGAAFALPPVAVEIVIGNVHIVLLSLLAVTWLGVRAGTRRGEIVAGSAIAVATLIKIFPGVIVLWFILTRRWLAAAATGVATLLLIAAVLPFSGVGMWLDYLTVLANMAAPHTNTNALAPTVWLGDLMGFGPARVIVTITGLAVLVWAAMRKPLPLSFGAAVMVSLLIVPALFHHYLTITILPMILALRYTGFGPGLAFAYIGMLGGHQFLLRDLQWITNRALPTLGAISLLIVFVRRRVTASVLDPSTVASPSHDEAIDRVIVRVRA